MTILIKKDENGVTRITLNRPEVHNAFNDQMISDLTAAFSDIEKCPDTRVVILEGAGKSFSAGADLQWMRKAADYSYDENIIDAQKLSYMLNALYNLKQLTIASVQGAAMGGGLGLIACCDIVVADGQSKFAFSEVKLGLIPATISPFVIDAIGSRYAKRYFQTAEIFSATRAFQLGLVSEVAENIEQRDKFLQALLQRVLANAPQATKAAKQLVCDFADRPINDELRQHSAQRIAKARASGEAKEGLKAFFDKRKADWVKNV